MTGVVAPLGGVEVVVAIQILPQLEFLHLVEVH